MKTNFDPQAQKAIQAARTVAWQMKNTFIGTEHLLIGILQTDNSALQKLPERTRNYRRTAERGYSGAVWF